MKTTLILATAAALFSVSTNVEAQERRWVKVGVDREKTDRETIVFADAASVHHGPSSTREVWFKLNHTTPQRDTTASGEAYDVSWELWFYRFDCRARKFAHLRRIQYSRDSASVSDSDFTDPAVASAGFTRLKAVPPQTMIEGMFEAGCALPLRS